MAGGQADVDDAARLRSAGVAGRGASTGGSSFLSAATQRSAAVGARCWAGSSPSATCRGGRQPAGRSCWSRWKRPSPANVLRRQPGRSWRSGTACSARPCTRAAGRAAGGAAPAGRAGAGRGRRAAWSASPSSWWPQPATVDAWVLDWLVEHHAAVLHPGAADRRGTAGTRAGRRAPRAAARGAAGRAGQGAVPARSATRRPWRGKPSSVATEDPDAAEEMRRVLAALRHRAGTPSAPWRCSPRMRSPTRRCRSSGGSGTGAAGELPARRPVRPGHRRADRAARREARAAAATRT